MAYVAYLDAEVQSAATVNAPVNTSAVDVSQAKTLAYCVNVTTFSAATGASVKLQRSLDGTVWVDDGSATNITATGQVWLEKVDPTYKFSRLAFAISTNSFVATTRVYAKKDN